jgi:hypothetical protein
MRNNFNIYTSRRLWRQLQFILFRLRFHTFEGIRYLYEAVRWRRHMNERGLWTMSATLGRNDVSARQDHDDCLTGP